MGLDYDSWLERPYQDACAEGEAYGSWLDGVLRDDSCSVCVHRDSDCRAARGETCRCGAKSCDSCPCDAMLDSCFELDREKADAEYSDYCESSDGDYWDDDHWG